MGFKSGALWMGLAASLIVFPGHAGMDVHEEALGRQLAEERCSACHAIAQGRQSPHGEAPPFAEIVKVYPPESLEEALAEGIMVGHEDMPEFAFTPEEVAQFVAYLKSLQ